MTRADNDNKPAAIEGNLFTLDEAAAHLRLTNRGVAKLAKRHGLCMIRGRDILFETKDIEAIKDILRCPSPSNNAAKSGGSAAPSMDKLSTSLRALTAKKSRKPSGPSAKLAS